MTKLLDSKCKKCRREGAKLFLKGDRCSTPKCAIVKRNYPPGVHGPKGKKRSTEYGGQLREKQKAKRIYGLAERQFRNYYYKAIKQKGDTGQIMQQLLQLRLDNVIYQSGLAKSRAQARQMITHGLFYVNNKKVNIPSFQVKSKDEITVKPSKTQAKPFAELDKKINLEKIPSWIHLDLKNVAVKILQRPEGSDLDLSYNPRLIVEFYSK
ncbi:MAG: 30S ribosomal protein S4 [Candidatus Buchananbacteria bacterium]